MCTSRENSNLACKKKQSAVALSQKSTHHRCRTKETIVNKRDIIRHRNTGSSDSELCSHKFNLNIHLIQIASSFNGVFEISGRKPSKNGPISDRAGKSSGAFGNDSIGSRDKEFIMLKSDKNPP
ncbi:hypothetical protein L2E82_12068 [Cichorium intybus]|uniref:Uncharacterized protein n=1 Tax=Cichorium intybus TaxID=13427 RepID=A0ACB9GG99_CICIN|nr:hypothetical protein L2E82_12068 [Cichorium intybus]